MVLLWFATEQQKPSVLAHTSDDQQKLQRIEDLLDKALG
jgi:hypothetical protein